MHCVEFRTAISARVDGEELPAGICDATLDSHLRGCADCCRWEEQARRLKLLTAAFDLG
ncbi:zf-HC2 domain-containing protein [Streptomyces syringium]|uniref:zf-HC2 domain-containing protein n=1 Tax=Streptomyces syringium TaxID=76729 RepID=UPI0034393A32